MNEIIQKLRDLRLPGMAHEYENQTKKFDIEALTFDERLSLLIEAENESQKSNKISRLLANAKFSKPTANIADIKYFPGRKISHEIISNLSTNDYISKNTNVVIVGACGSGKSYIANALGVNACLDRIPTKYVRLPDLLSEYKLARERNTEATSKVINKYGKVELLIIDEWLIYGKLSDEEIKCILEIIELRYSRKTTIVCSQLDTTEWHPLLGSIPITADAIMDRLTSKSIRLEINSEESLRSMDL